MAKYYGTKSAYGLTRAEGWAGALGNLFNAFEDRSAIGAAFKEQYGNQLSPESLAFINSMSDNELSAYLDDYFKTDFNFLGNKRQTLDFDSLFKDLNELGTDNLQMPENIDYEKIYADSAASVNAERQEMLDMINADTSRQSNIYQNELQSSNDNFNTMRNQALSSQYQNQAGTLNSLSSNLSSARQSALEAGANAGLRLAGNINTMMSAQNKQAQTSLDTANNLTTQLMQQRQAAASTRGDYSNMLSQNNQAAMNAKSGTQSEINNLANSSINTQQGIYDNKMQNYNEDYNATYGGNSFADAYKNYNKQQQSKYGY